jgi:hypothetical protein
MEYLDDRRRPSWVKLRSLTVRPAGLFSPQNRTSTQSSLPSLVVARPVDEFNPNRGRGKGQSHPCRSLKLGPIGACLIRASLSLFRPISHKRLVLMRFLRSLASEKSTGLQDHTSSPSALASPVKRAVASTAPRPASVTFAKRPSEWNRMAMDIK